MRRALMIGAAAIALLASSQAIAQTVVIEPEQRLKIREYVVKQRINPVTIRERVTVGSTVPADVELMSVPAEWGVARGHRYFYWNDHVVLVEPSGRRVIEIID
ncbi:MAG TPA: DUF1236 domain-containing protein [Xanthobacteraceae bacterium]|nr:DUF1236 domain-containing protein [Xanthobacteraceae bacterium]